MPKINEIEVPVLNIRGKEYPTVATRVQVAHQGGIGSGFSMISNEVVSLKDRDFLKITIKIGENLFSGTAEIHWNATGNTADATSPYETAETSALGRALAFAGYIIDSIASADEMQRAGHTVVEAEAPRQLPERTQPAKVIEKQLPAPKAKVTSIPTQCKMLADHLKYSPDAWGDICQQYAVKGKVDFDAMKVQLMQEAEKAQAVSA